MRWWIFATVLFLVFSGCTGPPADDGADEQVADGCPAHETAPTTGGRDVEVQVANNMEVDTCVRVLFDSVLVASGDLEKEHPALHNNPQPLAEFPWDGASVTVRVEDEASGQTGSKTVTLNADKTTWVVAWVGESGITIESYDSEPMWM